MKRYICDNCERVIGGNYGGKPLAVLQGIVGTSGGILLPEALHEKYFCKTDCFWSWAKKYCPVEFVG